VDWYDEIWIKPGHAAGIELVCAGPRWAPTDKTNLVYRAAELLCQEAGQAPGLQVTLVKNIPAGSGLGSASSDAAATLLGLNRYLDLGLPGDQLAETAGRLGSDVPFFLNGPLAYCTGRGEKTLPLTRSFTFTALLILSDVNSSTKEVYANYRHDPPLYRQLHATLGALLDQNRVDALAQMCVNMLQSSCFELYEELGERKETIESLHVGPVCLSGSGSTMFLICDRGAEERLEGVREIVAEKTGCSTTVVRSNQW